MSNGLLTPKEFIRENGVVRFLQTNGVILGTSAFCMFMILAAFAIAIINTNRVADKGIAENRIGIMCVFEQLEAHRLEERNSNNAAADHHGYVYEIPKYIRPPNVPLELRDTCELFKERAQKDLEGLEKHVNGH